MNNNFYRIVNLAALFIVCNSIGKIGLLGYVVSCVLMWNVIEGFKIKNKI